MPKRLLTISLVGCIGCASSSPLPVAHGPVPQSVWTAVNSDSAPRRPQPEGPKTRPTQQNDATRIAALPESQPPNGKRADTELPIAAVTAQAAAVDQPGLIEQVDFDDLGEHSSGGENRPITVPPAGDMNAFFSDAAADATVKQAEPMPAARMAVQPRFAGGTTATFTPPKGAADDSSLMTIAAAEHPAPPIGSEVAVEEAERMYPDAVPMNLPSVLAAVGGQHPVVGAARWRVREAYAQLQQAKVMWLPSIRTGFHYHRHDGNYQASDGDIVDVNRNSFLYGLGVGATGAGTVQQPGIVAQFHFADAIFQPKIAERTAWARGHAAGAALNDQLLQAALAYTELLGEHQNVAIVAASRDRTAELAKVTRDFAEAGEGLQADADRLETELALVKNRLLDAQQQAAVAGARLAQAISYNGYDPIIPMDVTIMPLDLIPVDADRGSLIGTGLAMRPELKESQALVAAACEAYRREKYAPFVPSVLLGFSTGGFGGGLGAELDHVNSRYDFDAMMSWEVRNLGLGEHAARSGQSARVQQAKFERVRVMDQIAREIAEGHAGVTYRRQQIETTRQAIKTAQQSYERNLKRIRDGEGLPLEVLQSVQALETANQAYLQAVVDYNRAQFQLQWAQGWPVGAPESE